MGIFYNDKALRDQLAKQHREILREFAILQGGILDVARAVNRQTDLQSEFFDFVKGLVKLPPNPGSVVLLLGEEMADKFPAALVLPAVPAQAEGEDLIVKGVLTYSINEGESNTVEIPASSEVTNHDLGVLNQGDRIIGSYTYVDDDGNESKEPETFDFTITDESGPVTPGEVGLQVGPEQ